MTTTLTKPKKTYSEFDLMVSTGKFERRPERFELIKGRIRKVSPPGPTHEDIIDWLNRWSTRNTDEDQVRVRIQQTVGIPELASIPMPDVALIKQGDYRINRPTVTDVLLLIEVADSSLNYDTKKKAALYAEAGVTDYWVVNIPHWRVDVFRSPKSGQYTERFSRQVGESVSPLAFPQLNLEVTRLFNTWNR